MDSLKDRKLFGINSLIDEFMQTLTKVRSDESSWSTEYFKNSSGQHWLEYVVDEHGFSRNLMVISPRLSTEELIEIAFSSLYPDEVSAAAPRLNLEEKEQLIESKFPSLLGH